MLILIQSFTYFGHDYITSVNAQGIPTEEWGVFFGTIGNIEFTINSSGLAVRILGPREFFEGYAENNTSFLNSTITEDNYYYNVWDGSLHYPYLDYYPYDSYRIEVHSPGYSPFGPPQKIIMKNMAAPSIAGDYTFVIYTANSLTLTGEPDFSNADTENVTIPVSMREDASSISGVIYDITDEDPPIPAPGIVYAKEVSTGATARAYIDASSGFFNITGLYEGDYVVSATAGFCDITHHAYAPTEFREIVNVSRGTEHHLSSFPLYRGGVIYGNITYLNSSSTPSFPMRSIDDNGWFSKLGITHLNYSIQAYGEDGKLAGEYKGVSQGDKTWDPFRIDGLNYSGLSKQKYKLKVQIFGYIQERAVDVNVLSYEETHQIDIYVKCGGLITGKIKLPETPRNLELYTTGNNTGALFGGNIIAEAYNIRGELKGLTVLNRTFTNGTVAYADQDEIRFYILGFSDFYNKTYSGIWNRKDFGLESGQYYIRVFLNGFVQLMDEPVTVSLGHNSTVVVECITGGIVKMVIESVDAASPQSQVEKVPWSFPKRLMRVWLNDEQSNDRGEVFDLRTEDIPLIWPTSTCRYKVGKSNVTVWYVGNNWSLDNIIYYGAIPNAVSNGTYPIKAYTYGYVEVMSSSVTVELPTIFELGKRPRIITGIVWLQQGAGIKGTVFFMHSYINVPITERAHITVNVKTESGSLMGVQMGVEEPGAKYTSFSIYGLYEFKPSGYQIPDHFYYVLESGHRIKDYGLEPGTYSIEVGEFGFYSRFVQTEEKKVTLSSLNEVEETFFEMEKLVLAYGVIYGYSMRKDLIPLSWVQVVSTDRSTTSLDGEFKLYLSDGVHSLDFFVPGYNPEGRIVTIYNASSMDVKLFQSGAPFLTSFSEPPQNLFTIFVNHAITKDECIDYVISSKLDAALIEPESVQIEWSSDKGTLNSTEGSCVCWSIPVEISSENCSITSKASIPEYGVLEKKLVLNPADVPEFSTMTLTTLVFITSIVIALSSVRRKEYI
jgi:hypothetical protein